MSQPFQLQCSNSKCSVLSRGEAEIPQRRVFGEVYQDPPCDACFSFEYVCGENKKRERDRERGREGEGWKEREREREREREEAEEKVKMKRNS